MYQSFEWVSGGALSACIPLPSAWWQAVHTVYRVLPRTGSPPVSMGSGFLGCSFATYSEMTAISASVARLIAIGRICMPVRSSKCVPRPPALNFFS